MFLWICLAESGCSEERRTVEARVSMRLMPKRLKVPASEHFELPFLAGKEA